MSTTLTYYNQNAKTFSAGTIDVDFTETQNHFLKYLPPHAKILDYGCGSGRDTKYFLSQGYEVEAVDGSVELCKIASEYTGMKVQQMLFQDLDELDKYDGIWACSSILHLCKEDLKPVIVKMVKALKPNGVIYTSFKYGNFEGERNGRYFTDFTIESFREFIEDLHEIAIEEHWVTGDVRTDRGEEKWLNLILRKTNF